MRLRGHHLACLLGFTGHGYDPAFTARLADLAARYRDGEPVDVVAAPGTGRQGRYQLVDVFADARSLAQRGPVIHEDTHAGSSVTYAPGRAAGSCRVGQTLALQWIDTPPRGRDSV